MKIERIKKWAKNILLEYNTSKANTKITGTGGDKASGKSMDNIIAGKAQPYKNNEFTTKYAHVYPALGDVVKRLKESSVQGNILINGKALVELQKLLGTFTPKKDEETGEYIMPFGDNVRMKEMGNNIFFKLKDENKLSPSVLGDDTSMSSDASL